MLTTKSHANLAPHRPRFARLGRLEVMAERLPEWHRPSAIRSGNGDVLAWIGPWHLAASILPRHDQPDNRV